jgi:hypothetical protein
MKRSGPIKTAVDAGRFDGADALRVAAACKTDFWKLLAASS